MRVFGVALLVMVASFALADSWSAPPKKWTSPNGQFALLRNDKYWTSPDLTLVQLTPKRTNLWTIKSPQGKAPYDVHFSTDGKHVVLLEEYGRLGFGVSLAFIGPGGKVVKSLKLSDILSKEEVLETQHTISSIWWMSGGCSYIHPDQKRFVLISSKATLRVYDVKTAAVMPLKPADRERIFDETRVIWREKLRTAKEEGEKYRASNVLATLRDGKSIPAIRQLMARAKASDQSSFGVHLAKIIGEPYAQEIEQRVLTATPASLAEDWFGLFSFVKGPMARASVLNVYKKKPKVALGHYKYIFFEHLTAADVRKHPEWLKHANEDVRYHAIRLLAESPQASDRQAFTKAAKDRSDTVVVWAKRGLAKLNSKPA